MEQSSSEPSRPTSRRQYLAVFSASIGALAAGSVIGYSSPALLILRQTFNDTRDDASAVTTGSQDGGHHVLFPSTFSAQSEPEGLTPEAIYTNHHVVMTSMEISWFSSIYVIGALVGGMVSSPTQNFLGRRGAMLASVPVALLGWLLLGLGVSVPMLLVGRLLTGVFAGVNSVVINTYVGEIASSDVRGRLGCSYEIMVTSGMLFSYGLGSVLTWTNLALVHVLPPALFALLMFCNYESPIYLISKGRNEEAKAALRFFKGDQYDIASNIVQEKNFQTEVRKEGFSWRLLRQPYIYRPLVLASTLAVLKQFSGINVVTFNLATIFKRAGTGLSEHVSSAISVSMELLAAVFASVLIERIGRKPLLMGSFTVMAVMLGGLGLFFYLLDKQPVWTNDNLHWLPLFSVSCYMLAFGMGIGSICFVLIGELFPPNVRESAGAFVSAINYIASFLTLFTFDELQDAMTSYGYYWAYAGSCVLSAIFCGVAFEETKGKTLEEISQMFGRGTLVDQPAAAVNKKQPYGSQDETYGANTTLVKSSGQRP